MAPIRTPVSTERERQLNDEYRSGTAVWQLSKREHIGERRLKQILTQFGPLRRMRGCYPESLIQRVVAEYRDGEPLESLIKTHHVCAALVKKWLSQHGVPLRKRTLNEDYFETWSPNMAWLLG